MYGYCDELIFVSLSFVNYWAVGFWCLFIYGMCGWWAVNVLLYACEGAIGYEYLCLFKTLLLYNSVVPSTSTPTCIYQIKILTKFFWKIEIVFQKSFDAVLVFVKIGPESPLSIFRYSSWFRFHPRQVRKFSLYTCVRTNKKYAFKTNGARSSRYYLNFLTPSNGFYVTSAEKITVKWDT